MSDADRLLGWFAGGSLVRPDASAPATVHLTRALASLAGTPETGLEAPAQRIAAAIGESDHYVLVLVDGLGMHLLESAREAAFLAEHLAFEMQAQFPSSTAPALTTLATGLWPAEHAVTGWWTYLPAAGVSATVLPYIERFSRRPLGEFGIESASVFPSPSVLDALHSPACWLPSPIAGSVYSRYFGGGARQRGYDQLADACRDIVTRIRSSSSRTLSYLYISQVDDAQHEHGPASEQVRASVRVVVDALKRMSVALGEAARVVVTADHGQIGVEPENQVTLHADDPLIARVIVPPTGDYRTLFFHTGEGERQPFAQLFRDRFGERWALLSTDEVEALRLFGPDDLASETRRRIGDFTAISKDAAAIRYAPEEPMSGYHGGLLPEEMRIPLIIL